MIQYENRPLGDDYGIGRGDVEIAIPWRDFGPSVQPQFLALLGNTGSRAR